MKRKVLGIIVIVLLMSAGCNKVVKNNQDDTAIGKIVQPEQSNSPSNNIITYKDEDQKEIQYGKLSFNIGSYHIVSDTSRDNFETYKCEIDKGETSPTTHMTITIREIEKQDSLTTESIISYLSKISPDYGLIRIYNNVTDDSGIISLYSVSEAGLTKYVVSYGDACYLIESDYNILYTYLLKNRSKANYEVNKQKIDCANSFTANVNETISYNDDKVEYDIVQGRDGSKYSAELIGKDYEYNFTLKNDKGKELLTLSTRASNINDVISFLDVNMDGYADIQLLDEEGALNNSYALYVWDDSAKNFVKVKCDEMISNFEVHNGYLLNWGKNDSQSGVVEKLVWKGNNTLIKGSEEQYDMTQDKTNSELIQDLFSSYENSLIQAINNNEFSAIENLFVDGSNLYNSQKKLVADLYKKNIQEKLVNYEIKDTKSTGTEGEYKVYVTEKIGIKYPGKQDFEVKEFNWIYTVVTSMDNSLLLTDIEKWNTSNNDTVGKNDSTP